FHPDHENKFAITDALEEVQKYHGGKIDFGWEKYVLNSLRERHEVFGKLIARRDVVHNSRLRFVTAVDSTWKEFCKESRIGKCHVNAYEDMWAELCKLFAQPVDSNTVSVDNEDAQDTEGESKEQPAHDGDVEATDSPGGPLKDPCPYG
ncbi:UNVERIFIED_CONTAM: hypothetical protein Sindi_1420200, partial [Sesamum indicum]